MNEAVFSDKMFIALLTATMALAALPLAELFYSAQPASVTHFCWMPGTRLMDASER
jgi:hypothetical protein